MLCIDIMTYNHIQQQNEDLTDFTKMIRSRMEEKRMQQWQRRWWKKIQITILTGIMVGLAAGMPVSADDDDDDDDLPERNWELMVGGGAMGDPAYSGADTVKFNPLPMIIGFYKTRVFELFIEGDEARAELKFGSNVPVALVAGTGLGESRENDEADVLKGTPTLKNGYRLFSGLKLELPWEVEITARANYFPITAKYDDTKVADTDYSGILADLDLEWEWEIFPFIVELGGGGSWMNRDYAEANYGVANPTEKLKAFQANSGLHDIHCSTMATMFLNERFGITAMAEGKYLLGDAADSPLNQKAFQPSFGAFAFYRF